MGILSVSNYSILPSIAGGLGVSFKQDLLAGICICLYLCGFRNSGMDSAAAARLSEQLSAVFYDDRSNGWYHYYQSYGKSACNHRMDQQL